MRSEDENRIETTEMRVLCGKTLKDEVRNENIKKIIQVENIGEYLRSQRLRWYEHVESMSQDKAPAMTRDIEFKAGRSEDHRRDGRKLLMLTSKKES